MSKVLIGLAGKAQVGKSTVAEILWKDHFFLEMAFADRLKDVASSLFGWDRLSLDKAEYKNELDPVWGITRREGLQRLGTEAIQGEFGKDFWVRAWLQVYAEIKHAHDVVVSDVRFEHEADAIRALGGTVVHIIRPDAPTTNGVRGHSSEAGITRALGDYVVINTGSFSDLEECVAGFLEYLEARG